MEERSCSLCEGRRYAQRGISLSVFITMLIPVLIICMGLAIDGGRRFAQVRELESLAAQAARAGTNSWGPYLVAGGKSDEEIHRDIDSYLANREGLTYEVSIEEDGKIIIDTHRMVKTIFLNLIGIEYLRADGHAISLIDEPGVVR